MISGIKQMWRLFEVLTTSNCKHLATLFVGLTGTTAAAAYLLCSLAESACGQFGILIRYKNRPNLLSSDSARE